MADNARWRVLGALVAGLVIGQGFGPAVAWAADRVQVEWPYSFRFEANRTLPVEVERPIEVKFDRHNMPELRVQIEKLPELTLPRSAPLNISNPTPSFAPLYTTPEATVFVAGLAGGECAVLRLDHATGKVSRVGDFAL